MLPNPTFDINTHLFVNRENEQHTFKNLLDAPTGSTLPALCFHGPGGVGKSWLRNQFQKILAERPRKIPWAIIDYRDAIMADDYSALLFLIAANLKNEIPCPEFFTAYGLYLQKAHTNPLHAEKLLDSTPRNLDLLSNAVQWGIGVPALAAVLGTFPYLNEVTPLAIPAAGLIAQGFVGLVRQLGKAEKEGSEHYKKYQVMSKEEIYRNLIQALVNDLKKPTGATQCQSVIFFDTVEQLSFGKGKRNTREQWITEFARLSNSTLVVLTGHDPMRWKAYNDPDADENDQYWHPDYQQSFEQMDAPYWTTTCPFRAKHLLQYKLHDLKKVYATELLEHYGITDETTKRVILEECYEATDGGYHPFSLALCIETAKKNPNAFSTPGQFNFPAQKREKIIERYLLTLEEDEMRWIRTLAFTPRFDRKAALAAFGAESATSKTYCDALMMRCFISRLSGAHTTNWFIMHGNMRKHIIESTPLTETDMDEESLTQFTAHEAHTFWRDYWRTRSAAASGGTP
ncbi:hypothetical protein IAD21_00813 [Abditibacteriota bacterium]|nr:hypothetical protein IAD21_00813 [Abditibacteriota bacterium]